ncbi:hypothetical protein TWF102_004632 [Orbilia oligospora]|uniref:Uncharacterized protein n=1 Tax=Orbilia oligospora TaxID=2813651 RepID=A0A7C8IVY4_ORBOL|nr:hypothetical protein TWF102_004632 [Orbilia oligospora]KAF3079769.1 hypothetical protein TWF706_003119 [Orbilia oligospora]KAF3092086.1 hypothetical protein TWF103_011385 [Orbilia oligospora]KAF3120852.1 hypothetical protein TWF703_002290 [Orbilia oligospora]KAF3152451.1 hypothetical protein TWF594_004137 [Orbilia oligospora]
MFIRSRNVWKLMPRFCSEGIQDGEIPSPIEFEYDIDAISALLATFYASNFVIRGLYYTSATFSLLLQRLKMVTLRNVDWKTLIKKLRFSIALIHDGKIGPFQQEEHTLNHIFGICTSQLGRGSTVEELPTFGFSRRPETRYDFKTARRNRHQIEAHEPVICLTLSIPIEAFRSLIEREKSEIGSPFFHLAISHGGQSQSFSALGSRFGKLDPAVVLNLDDTNIEEGSPVLFEDPEGWQGKSDVIFSCMVPTWIVLLKVFKVSLEFTPQPFLLDTLPAKVFECSVHDYNNVRLSTKLPLSILTGLHLSEENGPPGQGVKLDRIGASTPDESKKVQITYKIIFSENENRMERMVSGNPKDQEVKLKSTSTTLGDISLTPENRSVGAWNLHRINLDKSPPILISLHKYGKEGYEWVNKYFKVAFAEQELQHSRGTPTDEASGVNETLVGVKGTIYRMIIGHTGIRQKQSSSYLLQNPTIPQSATTLFPERSSRRSLIYTNRNPPFVPLEESLATAPLPIEIENLSEIQATEKEKSAWMQLSVGLVERCRTWVHKPSTSYTEEFLTPPQS